MGRIRIELAKQDEEVKIRAFLGQHWREQHVFVSNPELMRWPHEFPAGKGEHLTFMPAHRENDSGSPSLIGLLGFIPFRRFDPTTTWSEMALAICAGWDEKLLRLLRASRCAVGLITRVAAAKIGDDDLLLLPRIDTNDLPQ